MVEYAVRVCHGIKVLYSTGGRDGRKRAAAVTGAWEGEPASDPAPALHDDRRARSCRTAMSRSGREVVGL
jgi:hypothetical protein